MWSKSFIEATSCQSAERSTDVLRKEQSKKSVILKIHVCVDELHSAPKHFHLEPEIREPDLMFVFCLLKPCVEIQLFFPANPNYISWIIPDPTKHKYVPFWLLTPATLMFIYTSALYLLCSAFSNQAWKMLWPTGSFSLVYNLSQATAVWSN